MQELDVAEANEICWNVARRVAARFTHSTAEDLSQEIWLWIAGHQDEILAWPDEYRVQRLYRQGYHVARAYATRERAVCTGYEPQDEYFYRIGALRKILPLFYGEAHDEIYVPDRDAVLDLERAFTKIDLASAVLLREVFGEDDAEGRTKALAVVWEISEDAARMKVQRALKALQEALGGPDPYYKPPARRPVLSNAQARALIGRQYGTR